MNDIENLLLEEPVIAAVRNDADLEKAINSRAKIVFVLFGSIINIKDTCSKIRQKQKYVFVHVDMLEGLKGDMSGIKYINEVAKPDGIITTKGANVKYAKSLGLNVIQRVFIIDSLSLNTAIRNINEYGPDAIEIMPGIAVKIIERLNTRPSIPLIAGGLIDTKKDIMEALAAGAVAISTTCSELWDA